MLHIEIELGEVPAAERVPRLLSALAPLGEDEEIAARVSDEVTGLEAMLEDLGCEGEQACDERGPVLLIRRRLD